MGDKLRSNRVNGEWMLNEYGLNIKVNDQYEKYVEVV